ncbi:hypothetical protein GE09DRAFT_671337 [Coniochaeta sp. 2T2.1]|nr:hypothetical protein GE09DRAFT_671337 [Coniochaeta sp. 2T2.1]
MAAPKHNHDAYTKEVEFDEDYFTEDYFMATYQPLSNLPTPPPSCRDSIASLGPKDVSQQDGLRESALLGPAVHLVNLIPPTASLATPQVSTVHEILTRANLPAETIALAVCILDSLNAKFSQNWRTSCPLTPLIDANADADATPTGPAATAAATQPAATARPQHIDAVSPEVIVLASLVVAVKFLEDWQQPTHHYAGNWGHHLWTCEQINVTERCIMESLGYRIMPLWDPALIRDALADMERAGTPANLDRQRFGSTISRFGSTISMRQQPPVPVAVRKTLAGRGSQVTPEDTPNFGSVAWGATASATSDRCTGAGASGPAVGVGSGASQAACAGVGQEDHQ